MKSSVAARGERSRFRVLLTCVAAGIGIIWLVARYSVSKSQPVPKPFHFPSSELVAIDRDLQARFAVVPDKDFGIERTYGNQHYLYNPQTPAELATVAALKKKNTEVAFYLMSRALWLRSWDGAGYKPIQGPVSLTRAIQAPLPRRINFDPPAIRSDEIMSQDRGRGTTGSRDSIDTHTPEGTPVPSPTPIIKSLSFDQLQAIGNRVFEMAENAPKTAALGVTETLNPVWKVAAVPIRASDKRCLPCHIYQPLGRFTPPGRTEIELGDTLGVAFYLYNTPVKGSKTPALQKRP